MGSHGFIINTIFDDPANAGVSIILKDGKDLGGFSYEEQQEYLDFISDTAFMYEFKNVVKLYECCQTI